MVYLSIFLGAGLGGLLRFWISKLMPLMPFATFSVNVLGSFLMGLVMGYFLHKGDQATLRLFLTTGLLGGFTTFSAFSYEAYLLYNRGDTLLSIIYIVGTVLLSLIALVFGVWIVKTFL